MSIPKQLRTAGYTNDDLKKLLEEIIQQMGKTDVNGILPKKLREHLYVTDVLCKHKIDQRPNALPAPNLDQLENEQLIMIGVKPNSPPEYQTIQGLVWDRIEGVWIRRPMVHASEATADLIVNTRKNNLKTILGYDISIDFAKPGTTIQEYIPGIPVSIWTYKGAIFFSTAHRFDARFSKLNTFEDSLELGNLWKQLKGPEYEDIFACEENKQHAYHFRISFPQSAYSDFISYKIKSDSSNGFIFYTSSTPMENEVTDQRWMPEKMSGSIDQALAGDIYVSTFIDIRTANNFLAYGFYPTLESEQKNIPIVFRTGGTIEVTYVTEGNMDNKIQINSTSVTARRSLFDKEQQAGQNKRNLADFLSKAMEPNGNSNFLKIRKENPYIPIVPPIDIEKVEKNLEEANDNTEEILKQGWDSIRNANIQELSKRYEKDVNATKKWLMNVFFLMSPPDLRKHVLKLIKNYKQSYFDAANWLLDNWEYYKNNNIPVPKPTRNTKKYHTTYSVLRLIMATFVDQYNISKSDLRKKRRNYIVSILYGRKPHNYIGDYDPVNYSRVNKLLKDKNQFEREMQNENQSAIIFNRTRVWYENTDPKQEGNEDLREARNDLLKKIRA